jgi:hypothetical protein
MVHCARRGGSRQRQSGTQSIACPIFGAFVSVSLENPRALKSESIWEHLKIGTGNVLGERVWPVWTRQLASRVGSGLRTWQRGSLTALSDEAEARRGKRI